MFTQVSIEELGSVEGGVTDGCRPPRRSLQFVLPPLPTAPSDPFHTMTSWAQL